MLDPRSLERRFLGDVALPPPAPAAAKPALSKFQLALAAMIAVAALFVIIAAMRMTDRGIYRALEARAAPERFLADELSALRLMAMTGKSVVPARLYLGIEECFKSRVAMPFDEERLDAARQTLDVCADMEIGRLYAQGGAAMADEGRRVLRQAGVLAPFAAGRIE
jgi:hypothetical protein